MSKALANDEIVLTVPARAVYARIVRVGAAALALRQGLSFAEIDELRAAIDEAMALLLDGAPDDSATISCRFRTSGGSLELEAERTAGAPVAPPAVARFKEVVGGLSLTATVEPDNRRLILRAPGR